MGELGTISLKVADLGQTWLLKSQHNWNDARMNFQVARSGPVRSSGWTDGQIETSYALEYHPPPIHTH